MPGFYRQQVNSWIGMVFIATVAIGAAFIILNVSANADDFAIYSSVVSEPL